MLAMAIGETSESMTLNAQFAHVATLVPIDRVRVGKTYAQGPKRERSRDEQSTNINKLS